MKKVKRITLGYSVLNEYRKCPQKFAYRYLYGLVPKTQEKDIIDRGSPLIFGDLVHQFMERYYGGEEAEPLIKDLVIKAWTTSLAKVPGKNQRSIEHLELLLTHYVEQYPKADEDFQVHEGMLEYEHDFDISEKVRWRQHFDGIIKDKYGTLKIFEHKTSSGHLAYALLDRMYPNDQAVGYVYGARDLGLDLHRVMFNGLCSRRAMVNSGYREWYQKRYKGKEPPPLFMRQDVIIEQWMLDEWLDAVKRDSERLIADIESGRFSKNAPDACTVFGSRCPYAGLCATDPGARQQAADFDFEQDQWKGWEIEWED